MKKLNSVIKNSIITVLVLAISFALCLVMHKANISELITTLFVFSVFVISIITEGYIYGIIAAIVSCIAVNYAFTFPFFELSLSLPANIISAVFMIVISVLTSALITNVRRHDIIRAESENERMRANLLRSVSHDLRTPLTTIYGSSSALLENRDTLTQEQQQKMLESICKDSQWLVRIVENLLSITRIDSASVNLIKTPTVLEELIDSVIIGFKKRYPNQKVEIDIPDDIVIIPVDAILIQQVIVNILENAVQHALGMTRLRLRVFTLGRQAIFEISDNGCGIKPERLKTIFNGLYEQRGRLADSKKRNAGIGLSVCSSIIKAHGGDITAENIKSGGAIFRFTLETEELENE